jgi:hypothetical protein
MSLTLLLVLLAASAGAQDLTAQVKALTNRPDVARAMAHPQSGRDRILQEWKLLTEINAPSGRERERADAARKILETCKLDKVYYDSKGNLIAIRKGTGVASILEEEAQRSGVQVKTEALSKLPAAQIPGNRDSLTVRMVEAVHRVLGFENPPIGNAGSNNSNVALLAGLPAISTGAAPCGDSHSLTEWCSIEPFYNGIKKIILMEIALAGLADEEER